jgi:biotin carboxylase
MLEALAFGLDRISAAARRIGVELYLFTFDRPYYQRQLASDDYIRVIDVDTFDRDAVRVALDKVGPVAGLVSNTDTWARTAELLAEERGFANVLTDTERLRDKNRVRNRVVEAGLSRGRAVRGSDWDVDRHGRQADAFVVKDAAGTGSRHVLFADTAAAVGPAIRSLAEQGVAPERVTVEPYFHGPLYSAETYTTRDGTVLFGVNSRTVSELPQFRELDLSYPVGRGSAWEQSVRRWAADVLARIGRGTGPSHIEFVDTAHGFELVEVNARLGGGRIGEGILRATGFDPFQLLLHQAVQHDFGDRELRAAQVGATAGGFAQVLKYAARTGPLGRIAGTGQLDRFPGEVEWHPVKDPESVIDGVQDQRGCYGFLTALGPSPEAALHRAHAAARQIRVERPDRDGDRCR